VELGSVLKHLTPETLARMAIELEEQATSSEKVRIAYQKVLTAGRKDGSGDFEEEILRVITPAEIASVLETIAQVMMSDGVSELVGGPDQMKCPTFGPSRVSIKSSAICPILSTFSAIY